MNSFKIVSMVDWPENTPVYVEGYFVITLDGKNTRDFALPTRHAWVEVDEQTIIEPTLILSFENIMSSLEDTEYTGINIDYFPAVRFTAQEILESADEQYSRSDTLRFPLCTKQNGPLSKNALRLFWTHLEALASIGPVFLWRSIAKTLVSRFCKLVLRSLDRKGTISIAFET